MNRDERATVGLTPAGVVWVWEQAELAGMDVDELIDSWIREFGFDKLDPDTLK